MNNHPPSQKLERIGTGSLGGKGRGLGYLNQLVEDSEIQSFPRTMVSVPPATVLSTSEFEEFVEENELKHTITSNDDELIIAAFTRGHLRPSLRTRLRRFLETRHTPLAVRSSSLNEDAYDHPFAGLYRTVLLPNNAADIDTRLEQLTQAIKLVFASTYLRAPKAYMRHAGIPIEEESMAVILQDLAGRQHSVRYYPRLAGVAQSVNYFPAGRLTRSDGLCRLVVGLGFRAVEGDDAMSFSPRKPTIRPAHWSPRLIHLNAQTAVDVLDLTRGEIDLGTNFRATMKAIPMELARKDGILQDLESWWNREDDTLSDGGLAKGEPLLTFNRLLRGQIFPFSELLGYILTRVEDALQGPSEVEFTTDFERAPDGVHAEVNLVQVRRVGRPGTGESIEMLDIPDEQLLFTSAASLGNGVETGIRHIVYASPGPRTPNAFIEMGREVATLNDLLEHKNVSYLLIGPGRWGSKNRSLGIPVAFNHVAGAAAIVEISSPDFTFQSSQGTHFFHNIASGRALYVFVDLAAGDRLNTTWFDQQPDARGVSDSPLKLIELEEPLTLRVDGQSQRAQCYLG